MSGVAISDLMNYRIVNRQKLLVTRIVDAVGYALTAVGRCGSRHDAPFTDHVQSILVIRTAYLGDVMMAVPLLKPLRERFPGARISFLTSSGAATLLDHNPHVDEVLTYDPFWFHPSCPKSGYLDYLRMMRGRRFDLVIETRADLREIMMLVAPLKATRKVSYAAGGGGWLLTDMVPYKGPIHRVDYHLDIARYLGARVDGIDWGVYLTADEQRDIDALLASNGIKGPFVAVHPGSRVPLKCWPTERFSAVCDHLVRDHGITVVLVGSKAEQPVVDGVMESMKEQPTSLAGKLTLRQLAGVLSKASLLVCNDSAPMHIAAAMKTPVVAIFGPSKAIETAPYATRHQVAQGDFPCRYTCDEARCAHRDYHACMRSVTVQQVCGAVNDILGEGGRGQ